MVTSLKWATKVFIQTGNRSDDDRLREMASLCLPPWLNGQKELATIAAGLSAVMAFILLARLI